MDIKSFEDVISKISGIKHLSIQGDGEPFSNPSLLKMIKHYRFRNPNSSVSTISNGSLINARTIKSLIEYRFSNLLISLESLSKIKYNELRGGSIEKIKNLIYSIISLKSKKKYPGIGFAITILNNTIGEFGDILNFYDKNKMDGGIIFQFLQEKEDYLRNYNKNTLNQLLTTDKKVRFYKEIINNLEAQKILSKPVYYKPFSRDLFSSSFKYCPWIENGMYITVDGDVCSCCFIKNISGFKLGNIHYDNLNKIFKNRESLFIQYENRKIPENCNGCPIASSSNT
jgi:MoaA/NifB/PqqE/SkfB family radical SAM enzyme